MSVLARARRRPVVTVVIPMLDEEARHRRVPRLASRTPDLARPRGHRGRRRVHATAPGTIVLGPPPTTPASASRQPPSAPERRPQRRSWRSHGRAARPARRPVVRRRPTTWPAASTLLGSTRSAVVGGRMVPRAGSVTIARGIVARPTRRRGAPARPGSTAPATPARPRPSTSVPSAGRGSTWSAAGPRTSASTRTTSSTTASGRSAAWLARSRPRGRATSPAPPSGRWPGSTSATAGRRRP